jgi:hypothetical protein
MQYNLCKHKIKLCFESIKSKTFSGRTFNGTELYTFEFEMNLIEAEQFVKEQGICFIPTCPYFDGYDFLKFEYIEVNQVVCIPYTNFIVLGLDDCLDCFIKKHNYSYIIKDEKKYIDADYVGDFFFADWY